MIDLKRNRKKEFTDAIAYLKKVDPKLSKVIDSAKVIDSFKVNEDTNFQIIVSIIIGQQLSGKAADTILSKLKKLIQSENFNHTDVLRFSEEEIKECGISRSKVSYIIGIADLLTKRPNYFDEISKLSDNEKINKLIEIKGIGIWSASIFVMSVYEAMDIFPLGDGTLLKAIREIYKFDPLKNSKKLMDTTKKWSPYRSVASKLLWNWVDEGMGR